MKKRTVLLLASMCFWLGSTLFLAGSLMRDNP